MLPRLPRLQSIVMRGFSRGTKSAFRQEGITTGVAAIFGVLLLGQVLVILLVGAQGLLTLVRQQTDVRLEILPGSETQQILTLINGLKSQAFIEDVVYVTREQAYERVKRRDPQFIAFLEEYEMGNPFPETIGVRLTDLSAYHMLVGYLQDPKFTGIVDPNFLQATEQDQQVKSVEQGIRAAQSLLLAFVVLLATVLVFVLVELVRRRIVARRDEILIQQLVGATPLAIILPFSIEILTLLALALVLSLVTAGGVLWVLPAVLPSLSPQGVFGEWAIVVESLLLLWAPIALALEIVLLPVFALLGAFFGLLPRLKSPTLSMS